MKPAGLVETDLVRLHAQRGEAARGAIGEHHPHQLAAVRNVVVKPRLHEDFFHRRGQAFRPVGDRC